jgi:hypothetical protein
MTKVINNTSRFLLFLTSRKQETGANNLILTVKE